MSSTPQSEKLTALFSEHTVVDCDVHPRLQSPALSKIRAEKLDEPYRSIVANSGPYAYPRGAFSSSRTGNDESFQTLVEHPDDIRDPLMDEYGFDYAMLNPLLLLETIPDVERTLQEMRATNDVLIERFLDGNDDLYGQCVVTTKRPDRAAEEIDRMGSESKIAGVLFVDGLSDRPLGDEIYDPIYAAAEDNDLPVSFHCATGPVPHMDNFPLHPMDWEQYVQIHTLTHPYAHMATLTSLLTSGTPAKFSGLDFIFLEAGLGWIPYTTFRLNREYQERRWEAPLLEKLPEEYVREQFYFGTQPMEEPMSGDHMQYLIEMIGVDSLLFTTDHPHWDFDHPGAIVSKHFSHLPENDLEKLLSGNAMDVFPI